METAYFTFKCIRETEKTNAKLKGKKDMSRSGILNPFSELFPFLVFYHVLYFKTASQPIMKINTLN